MLRIEALSTARLTQKIWRSVLQDGFAQVKVADARTPGRIVGAPVGFFVDKGSGHCGAEPRFGEC